MTLFEIIFFCVAILGLVAMFIGECVEHRRFINDTRGMDEFFKQIDKM